MNYIRLIYLPLKNTLKKDINTRDDIIVLVNTFYNHVKRDKAIGPFFTEVIKVNWNSHLPKMYDFWENVIFKTGSYKGNTFKVHQNLHNEQPLNHDHFNHWLLLFEVTVNELYKGTNADFAKQQANQLATIMTSKLCPHNL